MKIVSTTLKRAAVPALSAGLLVTAFPTPAAAQTPGSTVFRLFGSAYLSARADVANKATATVLNGRLILGDATGVAAGMGCVRLSPTTADCGSAATTGRISVGLGNMDDTFDGAGVPLSMLVDAGPGFDSVTTGSRNDTIGVSDGVPNEPVDCGDGSDVVYRDTGDAIAPNCEARY